MNNQTYSSSLLKPLQIGLITKSGCFSTTVVQTGLNLKNRICVSAMTRGRCADSKNIANELHAEYYSQRASAGLIVTESIPVSDRSIAYPGSAGLYTDEQMQGWKNVVDHVHKRGGVIFAQLMHCGRQTHSSLQNGLETWAPSDIPIRGDNSIAKQPYEKPHAMNPQEIQLVISQFQAAAERARKAGFDGIELNGGHGHLIDQFLRSSSNKRTDNYGGNALNRARFVLELINVLLPIFGAGRIGLKLTPVSHHADMNDENPVETFQLLLRELSKLQIAYVVLKQDKDPENFENHGYPASKSQVPCVYEAFRRYFSGPLIGNGDLTIQQAEEDIAVGKYDLAQFARLYISNPDLVERVQNLFPIDQNIDWSTAFYGGPKGYTDYPVHQPKASSNDSYFQTIKLNDLELPNRIIMSAMERMRNSEKNAPTELSIKYYSQRAKAGLIVTEATRVSKRCATGPGDSCVLTEDQVQAWSKVAEAVHKKGGRIFMQLTHNGRATHSECQQGLQPWAPSAIAIRGKFRNNQKEYEVPLEMSAADIKSTIQEFVDGAKRAKAAGFDGVELNGGHGFLIDQFLKESSNKRTDNYGGSVANRCRFLLELVNAVNSVFPGRVGVKLTPLTHTGDMFDSKPVELYRHLLEEFSKLALKLAYVVVKNDQDGENTDGYGYPASKAQDPDIISKLRPHFKGVFFVNSVEPEQGGKSLKEGSYDGVVFAKLFITNPDLPYRLRNNFDLNTNIDWQTVFGGNEKGYTDFPVYEDWKKA